MSAFVVSHDHIDALLTVAKDKHMEGRLGYFINGGSEPVTMTDIGKVLLTENERSVCYRYTDCGPGNMPGKIGEEASGYHFKVFQPFYLLNYGKKIAHVLKGCSCYEYQSCETPDWQESVAYSIVKAIEHRAVQCLPDYEDAPWEINREKYAKKAA